MKTKFTSLLGLFLFGIFFSANAQSVIGKWKTIDDKTGDTKSVVSIYKGYKSEIIYGKVIKLFRAPDEEQNPLCDHCKGNLHNKPIIGMIVIRNMKKTGKNMWDKGTILDPDNGKTYDCKMWIEGGKLQVRGYLGWSALGRSQTWLPYKGK